MSLVSTGSNSLRASEFKIVVVGNSGVGKSSIINRILNGNYPVKDSDATGSAETKTYRKAMKIDGLNVIIDFWEIPAGATFDKLFEIASKSTAGILLVYDIHEDPNFDLFRKCQRIFQDVRGNVKLPVMVAANKVDLDRKCSPQDGQAIAADYGGGYYETSCLTGVKVDIMFDDFVRQIIHFVPPSPASPGGNDTPKKKESCLMM